jgi:hypothetical protein
VTGVAAVAHLVSGPARERRAAQLRVPATPVTVVRAPAPEAAEPVHATS